MHFGPCLTHFAKLFQTVDNDYGIRCQAGKPTISSFWLLSILASTVSARAAESQKLQMVG